MQKFLVVGFFIFTLLTSTMSLSNSHAGNNSNDLQKANIIFNWLEPLHPELLKPTPQETQEISGIIFRYYSATKVYIATFQNHLYFIDHQVNLYDLGEVDFWVNYIGVPEDMKIEKIDVTGNWNYKAGYKGCSSEAAGRISITRDGFSFSGQNWHHDCKITDGYVEYGSFELEVRTHKSGFQEAIQGFYDYAYGAGSFDVQVISFGLTRIDIEYHDNRDGSVEWMTLTRNQ